MFIFLSVFVFESRIYDLILSVYCVYHLLCIAVYYGKMGGNLGDMRMEVGCNGMESKKER